MKERKKKKTIYNNIKYGLLNIFPKEHPQFSIDNESMIFTYTKYLGTGETIYGELLINEDSSIYFWLFKSRNDSCDVPVLDHTWNSIDDLLKDKDIDEVVYNISS